MRKFIIFIIIITTLAGVVGYFYYQKNIYSKEVLKFEILGPSEAQILEEIEYTVKYKNNGDVTLEDAKLTFEYPKYSLVEEGSLRQEFKLEDIYPGQERSISFKGRLIGKENETKTAKATLSYRPKNLKAFYDSPTSLTTQIKSVPLTFEFDLSSRAESGREVRFSLNYFSNVDYPLANLGIKVEYPSGFQFLESDPQALEESNWEISSLNRTEGGRIKIKGIITGGVREQKIFRAILGLWQEGEFIVLKEVMKGVEIIEPSLYITQLINGSSRYTANLGDSLHYEIYFQNIGEKPFERLSLIARLEGELFDFQTIKSDLGECEPGDNSVVWSWGKVSELRFLEAGQEGKVEFWINLKEEWPYRGPQDENLSLKNKISVLGQTREEFITKVNSKLEIEQKGYIDDEIFGSEGPLPPKVGQKSYFTIIWRAKNFYNLVENVKVKANLPPEVELTGKVLPKEAAFTFDSKSREIVWAIDSLEPGQGIEEPVQLTFQIALIPTEKQKGKPAALISETKISGEDKFTEQILSATSLAIDTEDIAIEKGIVVE